MLGILVLLLVKDHQKTKDQLKSFDERIVNCTYTIQEHLLGTAVCSLIMLKDYPQSLTNANILGQGNLNLVSEKSGKNQGILLSIICGKPVYRLVHLGTNAKRSGKNTPNFHLILAYTKTHIYVGKINSITRSIFKFISLIYFSIEITIKE